MRRRAGARRRVPADEDRRRGRRRAGIRAAASPACRARTSKSVCGRLRERRPAGACRVRPAHGGPAVRRDASARRWPRDEEGDHGSRRPGRVSQRRRARERACGRAGSRAARPSRGLRSRAGASTEATAHGSTGEPRVRAGARVRSRPPVRRARPGAGPGRSRCSRTTWPAPDDPTGRGGGPPLRRRTPRPERAAPHAGRRRPPRGSTPPAGRLAGRASQPGGRARSASRVRCPRRAR